MQIAKNSRVFLFYASILENKFPPKIRGEILDLYTNNPVTWSQHEGNRPDAPLVKCIIFIFHSGTQTEDN